MMPIAPWLSGDTGNMTDEQRQTISKYAIAAGAGIALLAPNKYKTIGIAAAILGGISLVMFGPGVKES